MLQPIHARRSLRFFSPILNLYSGYSCRFDVGDVVRQYSIAIHAEETAIELTHRLAKLGARLLTECVRDLPRSALYATPQSCDNISYGKCG